MKDNKLYKVLRIIFLTLAIISLVFTLCKKVGLCAQVSPTTYVTDFPLPYGPGSGYGYGDFPLTSEIVETAISEALAYKPTYFTNGYAVLINEVDTQNNVIVFNVCGGNALISLSNSDFQTRPTIEIPRNGVVRIKYDNGSYSHPYQGSSSSQYNLSLSNALLALPNGTGYYLPQNTFIANYPVAFSEGYNLYLSDKLIFGNPSNSGVNFENGEVTSLPTFDPLPGSVDPNDDEPTLFDKLKGWLSTLSGNIQKGFKNIEENLTSFFKPYLDNIKGFFDWVTEPFDPEAASDSLEAIQAISDIRALNNVIGTSGIFDWEDVTPASRVAFTFDFGGAVLPYHEYEINFDWYTGTVKTLILSILVTFLVVGLLVTIINNIPSMIHGHSGDSGGGSN